MLRTTLRHLWRNRLFTVLNITGLAIGLSAAWIMFQYTSYEFGHDAHLPHRSRVYRVVSEFTLDGETHGNAGVPLPLAREASNFPGVELAVPFYYHFMDHAQMGTTEQGGARFDRIRDGVVTDNRFFQLVPYQWIAGNPGTALSQPNAVVLTKSRAEKYFPGTPSEYLPGQPITYNDSMVMTISGVVADLAYPSSFSVNEFYATNLRKIRVEQWGGVNSGDQLFLRLQENVSPKNIETQINQVSAANAGETLKEWNMERRHILQPMQQVHFEQNFVSQIPAANKNLLFAVMGVSIFLLLLACINYINLSTAQIPQRAREIGIRKTLGGSKRALLAGFLAETVLVTAIAVAFSAVLTAAFFQYYGKLLPEDVLKFINIRHTAFFIVALITIVSLVSGLYPGWLITQPQPVRVLRGQVEPGLPGRSINLRKSLIVFQFFIAQLFLAGAVIVGMQLHFLMNNPLGFQKDAVLLVEIPWKIMGEPAYKDKHFTMAEALKKVPGIAEVALGEPLFSLSYSSNTHTHTDAKGVTTERNLYRKYADDAIIPLYELELLAGHNLSRSDTIKEYVINETARKAFGFESPAAAIGQLLSEKDGKTVPIVGVVSDFHTAHFKEKIDPLAFMSDKSSLDVINIRLSSASPADWHKVILAIEQHWNQFYPGQVFDYKFYDDTLKLMYTRERNTAQLVNLATGIALLISCLGLFGLATFMAARRTKEIGIRKVLGASATQIIALLSREFLVLVIIGFLLSAPAVYFLMQKWLANYSYHIEIKWWMFAGTVITAALTALITVIWQSLKAALTNPIKSLRSE